MNRCYFLHIIFLLFLVHDLSGQRDTLPPVQKDTQRTKQVYILHADDIFFEQTKKGLEQELIGNIALYQDSTFFYCDTAVLLDNQVWARGNIQIIQGDSTSIFADSLYYSGDDRQAQLMGQVILDSRDNKLFTKELKYDVAQKIARYDSSGVLIREGTSIRSNEGIFWVDSSWSKLRDSVIVLDTNFVLLADSLEFDTENKVAHFVGPTQIEQDSNKIYCEAGYYDMAEGKALFERNASFVKDQQYGWADKMTYDEDLGQFIMTGRARLQEEEKKAAADSIIYLQEEERAELYGNSSFDDGKRKVNADVILYDQKTDQLVTKGEAKYAEGDMLLSADQLQYDDATGEGWAEGEVVWQDTTNDLAIFADRLDYNQKTDYVKATGRRPWIEIYTDDDTMFVAGDTLISDTEIHEVDTLGNSDTTRRLRIYHDVLIYKNDLQGLCDSMVYIEKDSVFRMFVEPVLWADTSQFSADTIHIFMKNKEVDYIHQVQNSMIVNSTDLVYYNQIKGKHIRSFFEDRKPKTTLVEGNAQSLYFATDEEDAYIAANKSICSRIKVQFGDKKIEDIYFITSPQAEMLPMNTPGLPDMRLEGYVWKFEQRPKSKEDVWRIEE